jgi:hypothetical protein
MYGEFFSSVIVERRPDRQTDRQTDRRTDGRMDGHKHTEC